MTLSKNKWILLCLVLTGCLIAGAAIVSGCGKAVLPATSSAAGGSLTPLQGNVGKLVLETSFPKTPAAVSLYTVKSVDTIQEVNEKSSASIKNRIPTADEAPALAEKSLEAYGGLPNDASLINAIPLYRLKYNLTTQTVEERYPVRTQVRYIQKIDGYPVYKAGISLMLGENGEILDIYKHWITAYEMAGTTSVISAEEGYEKLRKGETTAELQGTIPEGTKISEIEFGYYLDKKSNILKPIWVYKAIIGPDQEPFNLYVNAAQ